MKRCRTSCERSWRTPSTDTRPPEFPPPPPSTHLVSFEPAGSLALARRRLAIDFALGDPIELLVGGFLFLQVQIQDPRDVAMAQKPGPCHQGAIARDFVMLDGLSRRDQRRIVRRSRSLRR